MFQGCNRKKVHLCSPKQTNSFLHSRFAMRPVYSTAVFLFLGIFQLNTDLKCEWQHLEWGWWAVAQTQPFFPHWARQLLMAEVWAQIRHTSDQEMGGILGGGLGHILNMLQGTRCTSYLAWKKPDHQQEELVNRSVAKAWCELSSGKPIDGWLNMCFWESDCRRNNINVSFEQIPIKMSISSIAAAVQIGFV